MRQKLSDEKLYYWRGYVNRWAECQNDHSARDSGNDFCFPDIASHTGCFHLNLVCISFVLSYQVDIRQLSLF